jgi:hypothetical protein
MTVLLSRDFIPSRAYLSTERSGVLINRWHQLMHNGGQQPVYAVSTRSFCDGDLVECRWGANCSIVRNDHHSNSRPRSTARRHVLLYYTGVHPHSYKINHWSNLYSLMIINPQSRLTTLAQVWAKWIAIAVRIFGIERSLAVWTAVSTVSWTGRSQAQACVEIERWTGGVHRQESDNCIFCVPVRVETLLPKPTADAMDGLYTFLLLPHYHGVCESWQIHLKSKSSFQDIRVVSVVYDSK